jgi:hypothetical protein
LACFPSPTLPGNRLFGNILIQSALTNHPL